jgi:signal peptidase II
MKTRHVIFLAILVILIDQLTKFLAQHYLTITTNTGAAFGILQNQQAFLITLSIIVVIALIYYTLTKPFWELSLLLGGTIGNLIDRVFYGHVIDFITIGFWPVFNIADTANTIGVLFLLWRFRH